MLGVSSAATIGLHFMENYCGAPAYSGYPVTITAFGIAPGSWENLYEMNTGYGSCGGPLGYTTNEVIDTETSTNGLNPLPNGSITVTWFGPTANFDPFYGYAGSPPHYAGGGPLSNPKTGEQEIYATFIRDGLNFGPPGGPNNDQPGYWVDIIGLKSLFTNTPFVVELMASADSTQVFTNALIADLDNFITNSVTYPNTPLPANSEGSAWYQGTGGGLSTGSAPFTNTDQIYIQSAPPQHFANGSNHCGTISGFIITDKPVVSMSPQSVPLAEPGDTVALSAYAIGVPPLSYQWRLNGQNIPGATTLSNFISSISDTTAGFYDLVVTNAYGSATSKVAIVGEVIGQGSAANVVFDSNPDNTQNNGVNMGATWLASSSDGTTTRTGVMSFVATNATGVTVSDDTNFDGSAGTITFWIRSAGTDQTAPGSFGASVLSRTNGMPGEGFIIYQNDGPPGPLTFQTTGGNNVLNGSVNVSDNKWHFVAATFDQSASGGVALYVDGALDGTNSGGGWTWPTGNPLEIGYTSDSFWRDYNGLLDDFRFYSAVLSPSQISSIFSSGNSDAEIDPTALQMELDFAAPPGTGLVLSWTDTTAVLQSASSLTGPWVDVIGANSPYTIVPSAAQKFFRYRYTSNHTPQAWVSNPYLM
jgi:hypothetical protein